MPSKNKKQLDLIIMLGRGNKGIGSPEGNTAREISNKKPKKKTLFSKGKD